VEATLPSTVSGISSIMSFIVVIKNHLNLSKEAGAETTGEVDSVRIKQTVVAAAGPLHQQVHGKVDDVVRRTSFYYITQ
jgi:hypothetical protein